MTMKSEFDLLSSTIAQLQKFIGQETNVSIIELKTLMLKSTQRKLDRLLSTADL